MTNLHTSPKNATTVPAEIPVMAVVDKPPFDGGVGGWSGGGGGGGRVECCVAYFPFEHGVGGG